MIGRLLELCARYRAFALLVGIALGVIGVGAARRVPLDAIPDLSESQVIVFTEWPGRSPTLIEDQVTYPLVSAPRLGPQGPGGARSEHVRMSFVYVVFEDGVDPYGAVARARVPELGARGVCRRTPSLARARRQRQAGSTSTRWSTAPESVISASCERFTTIRSGIRSRASRASPRWRRSAASSRNTK
jgi:hypothetical protein